MRSSTETNNQFAKGVLATLGMLFAVAAVTRLYDWVRTHPMPDAIIDFLTRPMISIAELLFISIIILMLYVIAYMLAFGPVVE